MSLNQCQFLGHLGNDPETRYLPNGNSVTNFSVACSEKWKDKEGEIQERTEWVRCVMYGKRGEAVAQYFKKGSQIYVSGKMQTRDYEKDGQKQYMTEIICDRFEFCGKSEGKINAPKSENQPSNRPANTQKPADNFDNFDDDIPF